MRLPSKLKPGDPAALVAPASPVSPAVLSVCQKSIRFLGLEPVVMPGCRMSRGYLSGSDQQRAADLNRAFSDPRIKAVFCARGGYGSPRILPLLDLTLIGENPKIFVGYSDITALHTALNQNCGFITYHGPMPSCDYAALDPYSLSCLKSCLFSGSLPPSFASPAEEPIRVLVPGKARGILTGGNLSLLVSTLGSPYEIDTRGKILFLEEVGEAPYRVDRALTALSLAGKFRDCAGILLGTFTECGAESADSLPRIFEEILAPWKKPALFNLRAGHILPQMTLPLGAEIFFDTKDMNGAGIFFT